MIRDVITEIFDMQIIPNKRIAEWDETKWIVFSRKCFIADFHYFRKLLKKRNVES